MNMYIVNLSTAYFCLFVCVFVWFVRLFVCSVVLVCLFGHLLEQIFEHIAANDRAKHERRENQAMVNVEYTEHTPSDQQNTNKHNEQTKHANKDTNKRTNIRCAFQCWCPHKHKNIHSGLKKRLCKAQ